MKLSKWDQLEKFLISEVESGNETTPTLKTILEKMSQLEYEEHQTAKR